MEILKDSIHLMAIDRFFPRACGETAPKNLSKDTVERITDYNLFAEIPCDVAIYFKDSKAYYVDAQIMVSSEKKKDQLASFEKVEKKLDDAFGRPFIKHGRLSWALFESACSKRKIHHAVVEHRLYERFGFCESITVRLT